MLELGTERWISMARDKSVKIRLSDTEDKFLNSQADKLGLNRSEYMRMLLLSQMARMEEKQ